MIIKYTEQKVKQFFTNKSLFSKKHNSKMYHRSREAIEKINYATNLYEAQRLYPNMRIKKLRNKKCTWSLRLNKQYRMEFKIDNCKEIKNYEIEEITISRVHPHHYD